ncbi:Uncharacterized protein ABC855_g2572 [[Candida] zeylanoides]
MNVAGNAYYTSQYLHGARRGRHDDAGAVWAPSQPNTAPPSPSAPASPSSSDPDFLVEGITPAQLTQLSGDRRRPRPRRAPPPRPHSDEDYYLRQQKRYDESPYKPKLYTHKTFMEVFDDERREDKNEKYNPMEFVFETEERRGGLKRALRAITGKDDYRRYDYYVQKEADRRAREARLLAERQRETELSEQVYVSEAERQELRRARGLGRILKTKFRRRALAGEPEPRTPPDSPQSSDVEEVPALETPIGGNAEFHPWWNYVLSWVVYDRGAEGGAEDAESDGDAHDAPDAALAPAPGRGRWRRIKSIPRNTRDTLLTLQQPASQLFGGGYAAEPARGSTSLARPGEPQEYVVEVDDDVVDDELYYNRHTGQLERAPSAMAGGGPLTLVSNMAAAVKSIRVMKTLFGPIDVIGELFPSLQAAVLVVELVVFLWILYELSLLVDALCMMVKAVCAPMIAVGRLMNRVM